MTILTIVRLEQGEITSILKHSQFKEIPEAGHEVNLESPEKLASILLEFLKASNIFQSVEITKAKVIVIMRMGSYR